MRKRINLSIILVLIIISGLFVRKISFIPLFVGDMLWAMMVFVLLRLVFIHKKPLSIAILTLTFSFLIEISQLYHAEWIDQIRATTFGALVLGHGFLWSDIIAYTAGIGICLLIEIRR